MPTCTWLATYPKSGTTWTRFLIHELLVGPAKASSDLDRVVPSIHDDPAHWQPGLERGGLLCTHKAYGPHTERYGDLHGFAHVIRHPADALLSEARFFCLQQAGDVARREGSVDAERLQTLMIDWLQVVLHQGQTDKHRQIGIGSWAEHTQSWIAARAEHPHVVVRYEDLTAEPVRELERIASFFGIDTTEAHRQAIVERCSARALRAMEEREIAARKPGRFYRDEQFRTAYDIGLRFVGAAQVGQGQALGDAARARIASLFGEAMEAVGYRSDADAPVGPADRLRGIVPLGPEVVAAVARPTMVEVSP